VVLKEGNKNDIYALQKCYEDMPELNKVYRERIGGKGAIYPLTIYSVLIALP
jgi:hypothetical protein